MRGTCRQKLAAELELPRTSLKRPGLCCPITLGLIHAGWRSRAYAARERWRHIDILMPVRRPVPIAPTLARDFLVYSTTSSS
ncbi:hypothetical protein K438DRAFT_1979708 [Mycena galopus ATCC 62051]|nr:hypothetical protein K438DRAFT_1979708 [Mycena galopus ATCC 62051]